MEIRAAEIERLNREEGGDPYPQLLAKESARESTGQGLIEKGQQ
jgi:hypothetical protein